jgi:hypothetical protein
VGSAAARKGSAARVSKLLVADDSW